MTRRHFAAIADALKGSNASPATVSDVADALATFNPLFDRERFLTASGVTP